MVCLRQNKLAMLPLIKIRKIKLIQCPGDGCEHPQTGRLRSCTFPVIHPYTQGCTLCNPLHEDCGHATALVPSLGVGPGAAVSDPHCGYLSLGRDRDARGS